VICARQMSKYPEKAPALTPDFLINFGCCILAMRESGAVLKRRLFRILLHLASIQVGARHEELENSCPDWYGHLDADWFSP